MVKNFTKIFLFVSKKILKEIIFDFKYCEKMEEKFPILEKYLLIGPKNTTKKFRCLMKK